MSQKLIEIDNYTSKVLQALKQVFEVVSRTLGPRGESVILFDEGMSSPRCTRDGVTVAKAIELENSTENAIAQIICEASKKLNSKHGDGTTSCIVWANAIITNSIYHLRENEQTNINEYFAGMEEAKNQIVKYITDSSIAIQDDYNKIKQIAMISSNGDEKHSEFIADAYKQIGKYGSISCHDGHGNDSTLEIVKGMSIDRGYISQYFCTRQDKQICELETPAIMMYDKKISSINPLIPLLEECSKQSKSLLIIAEDIDGDALRTLAVNNLRGILKVCAIKAPGFGDKRNEMLEDIAILTGGKVISQDKGEQLDDTQRDWSQYLGSAKTVIIEKDSTLIIDGNGKEHNIDQRVNMLKGQIELSQSDYDKEKLQERIAKLGDGIAKISVSAPTETEMKEKKDRVEDAICATKSAIENGIVIGAGLSFIRGAESMKIDEKKHADFKKGAHTMSKASYSIFTQLLKNAYLGDEQPIILNNIMNHSDNQYGYNVRSLQYENMYDAGVIDPTSIAIDIIKVGYSIAKHILSSKCVISEQKSKNDSAPAPGGMNPNMMY